VSLPTVGGRPQ